MIILQSDLNPGASQCYDNSVCGSGSQLAIVILQAVPASDNRAKSSEVVSSFSSPKVTRFQLRTVLKLEFYGVGVLGYLADQAKV